MFNLNMQSFRYLNPFARYTIIKIIMCPWINDGKLLFYVKYISLVIFFLGPSIPPKLFFRVAMLTHHNQGNCLRILNDCRGRKGSACYMEGNRTDGDTSESGNIKKGKRLRNLRETRESNVDARGARRLHINPGHMKI